MNKKIKIEEIERKPVYRTFGGITKELYENIKPPENLTEIKKRAQALYTSIKTYVNTYINDGTADGKTYKKLNDKLKEIDVTINSAISEIQNYKKTVKEIFENTKQDIFSPAIIEVEKVNWYGNEKEDLINNIKTILDISEEYIHKLDEYEQELLGNTEIAKYVLAKDLEETRKISEKIVNQKINVLRNNLEDRKKKLQKIIQNLEKRKKSYKDDDLLEAYGDGTYKTLMYVDNILDEIFQKLEELDRIYKSDFGISEIEREKMRQEIERKLKLLKYMPKIIDAILSEYEKKRTSALIEALRYWKFPLEKYVKKYSVVRREPETREVAEKPEEIERYKHKLEKIKKELEEKLGEGKKVSGGEKWREEERRREIKKAREVTEEKVPISEEKKETIKKGPERKEEVTEKPEEIGEKGGLEKPITQGAETQIQPNGRKKISNFLKGLGRGLKKLGKGLVDVIEKYSPKVYEETKRYVKKAGKKGYEIATANGPVVQGKYENGEFKPVKIGNQMLLPLFG